jgi:hypothetical protein
MNPKANLCVKGGLRPALLLSLSLVLLPALAVCRCTATAMFPVKYAFLGSLGSEEIEFEPDHHFAYQATGDDGPSQWTATGTWKWIDQAKGVVETSVVEWRSAPKNAGAAPLRDREVWKISRTAARRSDRMLLRRVASSRRK